MDAFWQAAAEFVPTAVAVEYRLYYDDQGVPLYYSCDPALGNYIVVSAEVYAEGRYDCRVVDGKIKYPQQIKSAKLVPTTKGTACHAKDVSIISNTETDLQHWKMKNYEKD